MNFVPVIIESPWSGELNAQRGVALAIAPDVSRHILIPDPFWRTDVERSFKQSKKDSTARQAVGQKSIQLALDVVKPSGNKIGKNDVPIIINMGGRDSAAFLSLAVKYLYPQSFLMNILYPKLATSFYDLLAITPAEPVQETGVETIHVGSVPNMMQGHALKEAREVWSPILCSSKKTVAIIVGGCTGTQAANDIRPFTLNHALGLSQQVKKIREDTDCHLVLTTSRRTPPDVVGFLQRDLEPICFHSYFGRQNTPNPYMGYMACADAFVVTAESMTMMSEAADAGKRVYSYYPEGVLSSEHERFYSALVRGEHITPLPAPIQFSPGRPIRAADRIAETIINMARDGYRSRTQAKKIISGEYAL